MKDIHTPAHERRSLAENIKRHTLALAEAMRAYDKKTHGDVIFPSTDGRRVMLRRAADTDAIRGVFHSKNSPADCGIIRLQSYLETKTGRPENLSRHQEMAIHALRVSVEKRADDLCNAIRLVPLLDHDSLQLEARTHRGNDEEDLLWLSLDGISLCGAPEGIKDCADRISRHLSALEDLAPIDAAPWPRHWPFYKVDGHLVRAPGPGWARLKLHALVLQRPPSLQDLRKLMAPPFPIVMRVETEPAIALDADHIAAMLNPKKGIGVKANSDIGS